MVKKPNKKEESKETSSSSISDSAKELLKLDALYKKKYNTTDLITRDFYRKHTKLPFENWKEDGYKTFTDFKRAVLIPEEKDEILTRETLTPIAKSGIEVAKKKTYLITYAIEGDILHSGVYKAFQTYMDKHNAELVVLPGRPVHEFETGYDPEIVRFQHYFATEYKFNNSVKCLEMKLHPRLTNPLTGLEGFGKESSLIIGHPKIQFRSTEVPIGSDPNMLQSTGAITRGTTYGDVRTGRISDMKHKLGATVLDVVDSERFHMRHVEFNEATSSFCDLNTEYFSNGKTKPVSGDFYIGDYHSGYTDPQALKATYNMINYMKSLKVFGGDWFDATSISHHHENRMHAQLLREEKINTLEKELDLLTNNIKDFVTSCPAITLHIIKGNHEEHLDRYLDERRYKDDRVNYRLAIQLESYYLQGYNPIEKYVFEKYPELRDRVKFLGRMDSIKIGGVENALHGDEPRGGTKMLSKTYGKGNFGHGHYGEIYNDVYRSGVLTPYSLPYIKSSYSKWTRTNILNFSTGQRQLIHILGQDYRMN